MKEYTVLYYILSAGGSNSATVQAVNATEAAIQVREKLDVDYKDFEVIGVIVGNPAFEIVDGRKVQLHPGA